MNMRINGMRNRLSKPRRSINKNLTGCLQRYVVLGYEKNRKYLEFKINNIVLQIIAREHNFDFHRRNRDIHFSSFSNLGIMKFIQFNHTFGTVITHDDVKIA
jgi:hypothetical protein